MSPTTHTELDAGVGRQVPITPRRALGGSPATLVAISAASTLSAPATAPRPTGRAPAGPSLRHRDVRSDGLKTRRRLANMGDAPKRGTLYSWK
jgi:hypothetical protein